MIALRAERPAGRGQLLTERHAAAKRLSQLVARIDTEDFTETPNAKVVLQQAVRSVVDRIEALDEQLAPAPPSLDVHGEKVATRARLLMVLKALQGLPPGCLRAEAVLRKGIAAEMARLDSLKAAESGKRRKVGSS